MLSQYVTRAGVRISRAEFEANLLGKLADPALLAGVGPLLAAETAERFNAARAGEAVMEHFTARLPGEPWKGPR
jgi:hypothetical protein